MNDSQKYCRSLHAQISLGTTSDDRFMPDGYMKAFAEMPAGHVMTEKLDGENNAFTKPALFARSHTGPTVSPWTKPLRERWELIKNDLGDLQIFGEGMYGIHSIKYHNLESFYYVFGVREKDKWLSWEEVKFYANLFDFPTVPEIKIKVQLKDFYKSGVDENKQLQEWLKVNLGMTWEEYIRTPGALNGQDFDCKNNVLGPVGCEGFVIRNADSYTTNGGAIPVADNEFNNLMKLVRAKHVKTDEHWTKNWKAATLINYEKYNWYGYNFINSRKKEVLDFPGAEDIGKIVHYFGEKGVVIRTPTELVEHIGEICVRWDNKKEDDYEGYYGMPCTFVDNYELKYINIDGTLKK